MYHSQGVYTYSEIYCDRHMFEPFDCDSPKTVLSNNLHYNSTVCNKEANPLFDGAKEEFLLNNVDISVGKYDSTKDICHTKSIPYWYQKMLQSKINETKRRLQSLSNLVSNICTSIGAQIKRIEQDHNVTFCKMDYPRYPVLNKPWTNSWKFDCTIKCKKVDKTNHTHTDNCESHVILEHSDSRVSTVTPIISQMEYPEYVMDAVKLFQDFAIETIGNMALSDSADVFNTIHEKFMWTSIEVTVRSNYLNNVMLVVRGKKITLLIPNLKKYFESGLGRNSNIISILCIDEYRSKNKRNKPIKLTNISELKDQVGSILMYYDTKTNNSFNSVEIIQLGKLIEDYGSLTEETILLDITCSFGILGLMMSHKCKEVIGLMTGQPIHFQINQFKKLKVLNNIHNASLIGCNPKDILAKCSPLIKQCRSVAVLNLSSPYGKSRQVMQALRDIPSIWRIIVYGSFTNDFHVYISILTSKDDSMEEYYIPVKSCILDKLPTAKNGFDIAILFERKSLVTPKLEPPSPTLDTELHLEICSNDLLDMQENLQQSKDEQLLSYTSLPITKEFMYNCPTPPREKCPSPSSPPRPLSMETNFIHVSQIKIENKETNSRDLTLPMTIKSEFAYTHKSSSKALNDNNEPIDMEISPNSQDIEQMETPIHSSRNPNNTKQSLPPAIFTNITISDGFEFTVQANKSYLNFTCDPEQPKAAINIKTLLEEGECVETNDEVKIIGERKSEQQTGSKPRIRVKTVDEIMKMKSVSEKNDDLRILYEKRKKILEQLNEESKDSHERLSTSDLTRSYKCQSLSSSTSCSSRKHHRSSSLRSVRSPSFRKCNRSPSPSSRRRRKSPQSFRRLPSLHKSFDKRETYQHSKRKRRSRSRSQLKDYIG